MNKNSFLFLFIFLTPLLWGGSGAYSQKQGQPKIDSLQAVLKTAKEDTNKVNVLNALANEFIERNSDTSIVLSTQALQLSEKIKWQLGIVKSYLCLGVFSKDKRDYPKALDYDLKALKMAEEQGVKQLQSEILINIARVYSRQGDYPKAEDIYFKALKIAEEQGDKQWQIHSLEWISIFFYNQADYTNALDYCFKTLKMAEESGDKELIQENQVASFSRITIIYFRQGDYRKVLDYSFKALKISEELADTSLIANYLYFIGSAYLNQGDYPKALDYSLKALKIAIPGFNDNKTCSELCLTLIGEVYMKQGDSALSKGNKTFALEDKYPKALDYYFKSLKMVEDYGVISINQRGENSVVRRHIGEIYMKQNKLKEADKFLRDAWKISTEIKFLYEIEKDNEDLTELYSKKGDWKKAFDYYKQAITARDSINNEEKAKKQTRLEMNYEFEKTQAADSAKHEKEMAVANVENKKQKLFRNVSIGGFSVMLLFAGVFFTQRNRISKGKKRSDELLLNILPSETAEELKATGTAKAKSYDMVTVLFTDFKNFTQASEKMSAKELVNEIHYCYSEFDKIISKHGIEKIKTIGDSYMCAGGLPVENKTNPVEVVQAGLEIQQFIAKEKEERQKNNKTYFEIRIGINTGPVVAGIVGIKKFAYDIWGDTVNIASRMESSGEVGKVNISGSTYEIVKDKFTCTHRGKIDAKNKGMIDMYFVEGTAAQT